MPLDGFSYQGYVTHQIEQFVSGRFIVVKYGFVVDVPQFIDNFMGNIHHIGYTVQLFLTNFLIVNYQSVIQVSTLDQVVFEQLFHFAHKNKSTAGGYVLTEIFHPVQTGVLIAQYARVVADQCGYAKTIVRQYN